MPEMRRQNTRVFGKAAGQDSNRVTSYLDRGLTPEQKAAKQRDTEKAYERWREARQARLTRNSRLK